MSRLSVPTEPGPKTGEHIVHGTSVVFDGHGVLLIGAAGTGKSALALQLMAYGADLVADDRTVLTQTGDKIMASAPAAIRGLIEARGVGLLRARTGAPCPINLVVDLDQIEAARLPVHREIAVLGQLVTLLHKVDSPHFSAAILQYLKAGRRSME